MIIWVFTVIVYVFFIYGIIEFVRKIYGDFLNNNKFTKEHSITVIIEKEEEIEYIARSLKGDFNHITFVSRHENQTISKLVEAMNNEVNLEYKVIENLGEVENSFEE